MRSRGLPEQLVHALRQNKDFDDTFSSLHMHNASQKFRCEENAYLDFFFKKAKKPKKPKTSGAAGKSPVPVAPDVPTSSPLPPLRLPPAGKSSRNGKEMQGPPGKKKPRRRRGTWKDMPAVWCDEDTGDVLRLNRTTSKLQSTGTIRRSSTANVFPTDGTTGLVPYRTDYYVRQSMVPRRAGRLLLVHCTTHRDKLRATSLAVQETVLVWPSGHHLWHRSLSRAAGHSPSRKRSRCSRFRATQRHVPECDGIGPAVCPAKNKVPLSLWPRRLHNEGAHLFHSYVVL